MQDHINHAIAEIRQDHAKLMRQAEDDAREMQEMRNQIKGLTEAVLRIAIEFDARKCEKCNEKPAAGSREWCLDCEDAAINENYSQES